MILDTTKLSNDLRLYLELFTNVLFELPIENSEVSLTHEQVVFELNKDLLEFDISLGINGSEFEPGIFSQYLTIFTKTQLNDFELAIKWLKMIAFDTKFDHKQILISISNLLKEINKRKTEPSDLISSLSNDVYFKRETNMNLNSFMRQESFLSNIKGQIESGDFNIVNKLNSLRSELIQNGNIRFYFCADLTKLNESVDSTWSKYFPKTIINSNEPFTVDLTSNLKKDESISKQDFIINLGSTESSYLRSISSIDITNYKHENYAGLLVLIEYFTQTEGPLYEAVRGPGYAYHQSMHISPEKALLELSLDKCANLTKAYESTRKLFTEHLNKKNAFDENLFESAKNSLIFLLIDDVKSVSSFSSYSLSCFFKKVELNAVQELIKKIEKVDIDEMKPLLKKYLMPLFDDNYSNCFIICHPAKSESISNDFSEKFDRKLNLITKADDCLLN
ncbi:unnamed protein product [Brachionus calyciflorus]|uniref:Peptidase M16C associated domain-containing protein n=1 Tax=Brachionus calyciflorus TaxID=104777 RepID=A0A814DV07_9BILA|nr:unnamed protein product [Brachionus calyciflorus]